LGVSGFDASLFAAEDGAGLGAFGDWVAGAAWFADAGLDAAAGEVVDQGFGVVAAVCPYLGGDVVAGCELVEER
jgi:hypothetical protein